MRAFHISITVLTMICSISLAQAESPENLRKKKTPEASELHNDFEEPWRIEANLLEAEAELLKAQAEESFARAKEAMANVRPLQWLDELRVDIEDFQKEVDQGRVEENILEKFVKLSNLYSIYNHAGINAPESIVTLLKQSSKEKEILNLCDLIPSIKASPKFSDQQKRSFVHMDLDCKSL